MESILDGRVELFNPIIPIIVALQARQKLQLNYQVQRTVSWLLDDLLLDRIEFGAQ